MNEENIKKIKYLQDNPLDKVGEDALSHESIATTLKEAIEKWDADKAPFTIGLFGGWGTGKSTIGKFLKSSLDGHPDKIRSVEFDIWKYEDDAFRRQFLVFLDGEQGLNTQIPEIKKIYETSSYEKETGELNIDKLSLTKILAFSIIAGIGLALFFYNDLGNELLKSLSGVVGFSAFVGIFTVEGARRIAEVSLKFLGGEAKNLLKMKTKTITEHRIEFGEQFERLFGEIIDKARENCAKVVITIDNLDRVSDDKIVELLSAVKTFLGKKGVCFLIQCDEDAVKRHLKHIYLKEQGQVNRHEKDYTDEFLRKFFNTFLRIPPFIKEDLDEYTSNLLTETNAPFASGDKAANVANVIASAYRDNPRQVKQFINALISHFILAYFRENGAKPVLKPKGIVTDNTDMLAKTIVLNRDFPEFLEQLRERPYLWNEIDTILRGGTSSVDEANGLINEERGNDRLDAFLNATITISTKNIKPFIYLKASSYSATTPEADELEEALLENKKEKASGLIAKLTKESSVNYSPLLTQTLQSSAAYPQRIFNIVNSVLYSLERNNISLAGEYFYNQFAKHVNKNKIEGFELDLVFDTLLPSVNDHYRKEILDKYIALLTNIQNYDLVFRKPLAVQISKHFDWFNPEQKNQIKIAFETNGDFLGNLDILTEFFENEAVREAILSQKFLREGIASIIDNDFAEDSANEGSYRIETKVDLMFKLKKIVNQQILTVFFEKISAILDSPKITNEKIRTTPSNIEILNSLITKILSHFTSLSVGIWALSTLGIKLLNSYRAVNDYALRSFYIRSLVSIKEILGDSDASLTSQITQVIDEFLDNAPLEVLQEVFNKKQTSGVVIKALENSRHLLEQRGMHQADIAQFILDTFFGEALETAIRRILKDSPHYQLALNKVKELAKKIKEKRGISDSIFVRGNQLDIENRANVWEVLADVNCKDPDFISTLSDHMANLLASGVPASEKRIGSLLKFYDKRSYFTKDEVRSVLTRVIDILNPNQTLNRNHIDILKLLAEYKVLLSNSYQDSLAVSIIKKYGAHNATEDEVATLGELIKAAKLVYAKFGTHYEDLLSLISGADESIKRRVFDVLRANKGTIHGPESFWVKLG